MELSDQPCQALVCISNNPDLRLRDLAQALDVTERTALNIVTDLTEAGYVVKQREGRRNRYHVQAHLPLPDRVDNEWTVGEMLDLLVDGQPSWARRLPLN